MSETWLQRVREFVARWYEKPIDVEDGNTDAEVAGVAAALGYPLPGRLVDWYQLLGRRLRPLQDRPVTLRELCLNEAGRVAIWGENQGVWNIETPLEGEDPAVVLDDNYMDWPGGALSEILLCMLTSDTLVGAWGCTGRGPLGKLHQRVVGGHLSETSDTLNEHVRQSVAPRQGPTCPFFIEDPWRGDDELVVRFNGNGWEWMASTEPAFHRACQILRIDPQAGALEVIVSLDGLDSNEWRAMAANDLRISHDRLSKAVGNLGWVEATWTIARRGHVRFHVHTRDPGAVLDAVRRFLPPDLAAKLVVARQVQGISRFEVIHPAGLEGWWPPA